MSGFTLGREDHDMVRDYITAKDEYHYAGLPEDVVAIVVTHSNLPSKFMDLRFNLHTTLGEVKERFRLHFGTPVEFQRLTLLDGDRLLCKMNDNSKKLGYYSVESGNIVHIVDEDPFSLSKNGGLTDTSLVEKVRMSDKDYDKRDNSVRKQIQEAKAKKALEKMLAKENPAERGEPAADEGADSVKHIVDINDDGVVNGIGARCEVQPGARRGVVAWVGESEHLKVGHWVSCACSSYEHTNCVSGF